MECAVQRSLEMQSKCHLASYNKYHSCADATQSSNRREREEKMVAKVCEDSAEEYEYEQQYAQDLSMALQLSLAEHISRSALTPIADHRTKSSICEVRLLVDVRLSP